jgi:hypothetical protein
VVGHDSVTIDGVGNGGVEVNVSRGIGLLVAGDNGGVLVSTAAPVTTSTSSQYCHDTVLY